MGYFTSTFLSVSEGVPGYLMCCLSVRLTVCLFGFVVVSLSIRGRVELRKKLKCKSFKWYLDNVYPELKVPDDSDSQSGVIRQRQNCLESRRVEGQEMPILTLGPCAGVEGVPSSSQEWVYTHGQQIRQKQHCLSVSTTFPASQVLLLPCNMADGKQV
ncbi:hypothetical protein ILYODFUR_009511 [Ilyodon furcidens]|uniref:Ricin B lectin domain-containing protein n=1 Tax=Ilyodon furcidens TaxID=33524 RepID=A0ABV0V1P2_9TELE